MLTAKNFAIHGLSEAICEMSGMENDQKPKLGFSQTKRLFIIDIQLSV